MMSLDLPRRERFAEKKGLPFYRRLIGSTRSCSFQGAVVAATVFFIFAGPYIAQYLYYREYNPQGVGGFECRGVVNGFEPALLDGQEFKIKEMPGQYRMTSGKLLLLEKGFRPRVFDATLPAGEYDLAFRLDGEDKDGDFQVILRDSSGAVLHVFTQHLKRNRWYARGYDLRLSGGTYEFEVTPPSGLRWCMEVALQ